MAAGRADRANEGGGSAANAKAKAVAEAREEEEEEVVMKEEQGVVEEKEDGEGEGKGQAEGMGEPGEGWAAEEGEEGGEEEGEEVDWSDLAPFDLYKSLGVAPKPPTTAKPPQGEGRSATNSSTNTANSSGARPKSAGSSGGVVGGDSRLRAQFHRRSLKYHPSHFRPVRSGNTMPVLEQRRHAHLRFRQVALAFVVLKDPARREVYDSAGFNGLRQSEAYADDENNLFWWDPFTIFDSFFR